jgi:hypothetical protein
MKSLLDQVLELAKYQPPGCQAGLMLQWWIQEIEDRAWLDEPFTADEMADLDRVGNEPGEPW